MKCLFDLLFIRYNLYVGVSMYAYHILDYIVQTKKTDEFVLLLNSNSEKQILERYPQFKYVTIDSGIFKKTLIVRTLIKAFTNIHKQLNSYKLVMIGKRNEYWYNKIIPLTESAHIKDK